MELRLEGDVRVIVPPTGALTVVLHGLDSAGRPLELALAGTSPAALPPELREVRVLVADGRVRVLASGGAHDVVAASVHGHHDLSAVMRAALPPRPVPAGRRLLLGLALRLARFAVGRRLLLRLRAATMRS